MPRQSDSAFKDSLASMMTKNGIKNLLTGQPRSYIFSQLTPPTSPQRLTAPKRQSAHQSSAQQSPPIPSKHVKRYKPPPDQQTSECENDMCNNLSDSVISYAKRVPVHQITEGDILLHDETREI